MGLSSRKNVPFDFTRHEWMLLGMKFMPPLMRWEMDNAMKIGHSRYSRSRLFHCGSCISPNFQASKKEKDNLDPSSMYEIPLSPRPAKSPFAVHKSSASTTRTTQFLETRIHPTPSHDSFFGPGVMDRELFSWISAPNIPQSRLALEWRFHWLPFSHLQSPHPT